MAGMDWSSRLHARRRYAQGFPVNYCPTIIQSDSPNAPLRFVLSGQENTRVHVGLFYAINNCVCVHHGLRIVQIDRYANFTRIHFQSQNMKITSQSEANNVANWWKILLGIENPVEFLHV